MLSFFAICAMVFMVIASGAFTSVLLERNVSLTLADDTYGMVALSPGPEGQNYFSDTDGDGTFELHIDDAPLGEETHYASLFTITNNLNRTISISIADEGQYDDAVRFVSSTVDLEADVRSIPIGNSIDVSVDVLPPSSAEGDSLLSQITIQVYEAGNVPLIMLTRNAEVYAAEDMSGPYDPYVHTMPENAEYVRTLAFEVLEAGGSIRTWGSHRYKDIGLEPNVWNKVINGYTIKYNEVGVRSSQKEPVIQVSPQDGSIRVRTVEDGIVYTIYNQQSFYLTVYDRAWYAMTGAYYEEVVLWEFY
jgi:hypothetical protein